MSESAILERVYEVIRDRRARRPDGSYVVSLLDGGLPKMGAKVREEAEELIEAVAEGDRDHVAHEAADLLFHVLVLLSSMDLPLSETFEQLERRFGVGGLAEKAAR